MLKRNEISWCFISAMLCKIVLVSALIQQTLGYDIFEDDKRQGMIPLARLGRAGYWAYVDDKKLSGGMIPYPRLGRKIWQIPQTLIPYPRAGRTVLDPESLDYDLIMTSDYTMPGLDDPWTDAFLDNRPIVQKRGNIAFIPRIGRKKRSITDEKSENADGSSRHSRQDAPKTYPEPASSFWEELDDFSDDYFYRPDRQGTRSRNSFVPRVGKKSSDDDLAELESKRAVAFTPRIGRASLIPRIGRNDQRFKVKSRGAFIPRIGRRAAFIPRIGRSDQHQGHKEEAK